MPDNIKKYKGKYRLLVVCTPNYINKEYKTIKAALSKHEKKLHGLGVKILSRVSDTINIFYMILIIP